MQDAQAQRLIVMQTCVGVPTLLDRGRGQLCTGLYDDQTLLCVGMTLAVALKPVNVTAESFYRKHVFRSRLLPKFCSLVATVSTDI